MKEGRIELLMGILVGVLPFMGLPSHFFRIALPLIGVTLVYSAYRRRSSHKENPEKVPTQNNKEENYPPPKRKGVKKIKPEKIPIVFPEKKEQNTPNRKHLSLALQMLGNHYKQKTETGRLASRIKVEKRNAYRDMHNQKTEKTPPKEETFLELVKDSKTDEEIELIIDEDILEEAEEKMAPEPTEERIPEEISDETPEETIEEDLLITRTPKMDLGLLSRIGDEIEE